MFSQDDALLFDGGDGLALGANPRAHHSQGHDGGDEGFDFQAGRDREISARLSIRMAGGNCNGVQVCDPS